MGFRLHCRRRHPAASAATLVATDRESIIRIWNPGAERILGYRADARRASGALRQPGSKYRDQPFGLIGPATILQAPDGRK
jgi:PAS domain-containing protein